MHIIINSIQVTISLSLYFLQVSDINTYDTIVQILKSISSLRRIQNLLIKHTIKNNILPNEQFAFKCSHYLTKIQKSLR